MNTQKKTLCWIAGVVIGLILVGTGLEYGWIRAVTLLGILIVLIPFLYFVGSVAIAYHKRTKVQPSDTSTPNQAKKGRSAWRWIIIIFVLVTAWKVTVILIKAKEHAEAMDKVALENAEWKAKARWYLTWTLPAGQYTAGGRNQDSLEVEREEIEEVISTNLMFCTIGHDSHNNEVRTRYRLKSENGIDFSGSWIEIGGDNGGTISLHKRDKGFYYGTMTINGALELNPTVTLENKPNP